MWLRALGLGRRETRAWALYDWANSAFATTMMAAVLPIYYINVACVGVPEHLRVSYWAYSQTAALVIIAILSPILGAAADYLGAKKKFLAGFVALGVAGSLSMSFTGEGDWLFVVGNIGFSVGDVFYESLLPHLAKREEVDRLSTAGYALGYVGGGLLLALQLLLILAPERFGLSGAAAASRVAFASVAFWWAVFSVPLFRNVPEPLRRLESGETIRRNAVRAGVGRVAETLESLRGHRQVFIFLLAFWCYNDGINTIVKMAAAYGAQLGIGQADLLGALLLVQFLGVPCSFAYGALAGRVGARPAIYLGLVIYTGISVLAFYMTTAWHFWLLACGVAAVQGGTQALSRSLYTTLIPAGKSSEFFGFYGLSGKFGNIFGPALFGLITEKTGSSRWGVLAVAGFFLGGMFLLSRVDLAAGASAARREEQHLMAPDTSDNAV
jgi:UMF1 family MFS transporter